MATVSPSPASIGPDIDRGSQLLAIAWSLTVAALVSQLLRLYCRLRIRNVGWDDYFMFLTMALFLAFTIILSFSAVQGGGRHAVYLMAEGPEVLVNVAKLSWMQQPFLILSVGTGKASVGTLILRLLPPQQKWQRVVVWFSMVTVNIILIIAAIITFAQCSPPSKLWNPTLPGHCWAPTVQNDYAIFASAYSAFMDIVLAIIPLTVFRSLQISRRKKLGLCFLFSLGLFAGIAAAYKTARLPGIAAEGDFTWNSYPTVVWAIVEAMVVIVSGTAPALKPLYDQLKGKTMKSKNSYYAKRSGYSLHDSHNSNEIPLKESNHKLGYSRPLAREVQCSQGQLGEHGYDGDGIKVNDTFEVAYSPVQQPRGNLHHG